MFCNKIYKPLSFNYSMRVLKKGEDLMVELKENFQRDLFTNLINKYGRFFLSKKLNKSPSILYLYKNNYVKSIPLRVINKAVRLSTFSKDNLKINTKRMFSAKDFIHKIMYDGAKIKHQKMKEDLSIKIGAFSLLEENNGLFILDMLNWLNKNSWIEKLQRQKGLVNNAKIDKISKKHIVISYTAYNRRTKKGEHYIISLPRELQLNTDFCYFLGLLYGDGLNGARVGIVNKDKSLINYTANFLKTFFKNNKIKSQVNIYNPKINPNEFRQWLKSISDEFGVYYNDKARGSYVFNIFITNKILRRAIDDLLENLEYLFEKLESKQKGAFLAGLFDAEGNVNKLDKNLRFSQKIETKVKVIQNILSKEGYHQRYDGSNILIGYRNEYKEDLKLFEIQVLPFLKHSEKSIQAKELLSGYFVMESYKQLLKIISTNSNISQKQIAKLANKVKCHRELNALADAYLVKKTGKLGESFKYTITDEGLRYLEEK